MLIVYVSLAAFCGADVIPDNFVYRDISQYTVRYVSESGSDSGSCLANQTYPATANANIDYCRTVQFALTGSYNFSSENISRVIVLALPGRYLLGESGIKIYHSDHVILSRLPGETREVILSCSKFKEFSFNNLYFYNSSYIAVNGIVLTQCGQQSTALSVLSVKTIVVSNTTFRYAN